MAIKRIPLMFFPLSSAKIWGPRFKGIGVRLHSLYPSISYDLKNLGIEVTGENYAVLALLSSLLLAIIISVAVGIALSLSGMPLLSQLLFLLITFLAVLIFFTVFFLTYPRLLAKSIGASINRELIFVVRDIMIQISSGIPLFTALENIANARYRFCSPEFRTLVNNVKTGSPLVDELEAMAIRTESEYLKKTVWQLVTAMRSGADLSVTLKSIAQLLVNYQLSISKSFAGELNFIVLIYMLVSAVLPTIGITVMVIFSVFGLLGITAEVLLGLVILSFLCQFIIILYVYFRRPSFFIE